MKIKAQNDREKVLNNTRKLNESLHKKDIDEDLRSQFVGTALLYVQNIVRKKGIEHIDEDAKKQLHDYWRGLSADQIRTGIEETLKELLGKSKNKDLKIQLLQKNVLDNQKVLKLSKDSWVSILDEIVWNIYRYINTDSPEGQDILNLFFIHFNKYTGKKDKNQAFTPDHITHFMCRVTGVNRTKRIFDGTCGSGSFLVQSMVMEYDDCNKQAATEDEKRLMRKRVSQEHIYGIEIEDVAFGLATTNMLIHGDGNSNIEKANLFESEEFLRQADPDIILMNPPYNAKPITIPDAYTDGWSKDAKEDPTKGLVFLKFISDVVEKMNKERMAAGQSTKEVKVAILLQVSAAIGGNQKKIVEMKKELLKANRLDAVFTLPDDVFYPGASPSVCCMVFTLGVPHVKFDGSVDETFFGYYKDDGHKKKKNLGRIEQFDKNDNSLWKQIEDKWVKCFANKTVEDGFSALHAVTGDDEWLCEAYMNTDYSDLAESDFQETVNKFLAFQVKEGKLSHTRGQSPLLNPQVWKDYRFGDLISEIYKAKAINKDDLLLAEDASDSIRYITRTANDNGCELHAVKSELPQNIIEAGNAISIGDTTATCFYQNEEFIAGDHMVIVRADSWLNKFTGLFVVAILQGEQYKYSYGRAYLMERIMDTTVKLPSDAEGNPDWKFMEDYIKSLPYGDRLTGEGSCA